MAEDLRKTTDSAANDKGAAKKIAKKTNKKPGFFAKAKSFFKETKSEVSKVVWPSPKQLLNNTLIVLSVMILSAVFIGLIDFAFNALVKWIVA